MKKTILLAVLALVLVAVPAFASVQNVKVSGDIDSTWLTRSGFDLGVTDRAEEFDQNLFFTQTRLRVDAGLTDNVDATVALINERAWNEDSSAEANDMDLNLAFVKMREMLYSPLTVTIGRQVFAFGNSFVVDATGTNNNVAAGGLNSIAEDFTKRTAKDAIRLTLDYNPLTIDIIGSKIASNNNLGTGSADDDVDLFGANANYQLGDDMDSVIEGYFWAKIDQSTKDNAGNTGAKADTVYMPGLRASTNPIKGLNLQAEGAVQMGNRVQADASSGTTNVIRRAYGLQGIGSYMLPFEQTAKYQPVVTGVYTLVSGDSGPQETGTTAGDDHYTAWDPMFENQGGGTIYNTLFNLTNARIVTAKASFKPMEDVTASLQYDAIYLDKEINDGDFSGDSTSILTLLQPDGSTITGPADGLKTTSNMKLGDEFGVGATYDYTEDVQFGVKSSWFRPGGAFHEDNNEVAFQSIVNANVRF